MLDRFLWGNVQRISPEAPVPVVRVEREGASLGGAGNVARNLAALGGQAFLVGVRGADQAGGELVDLLLGSGIRFDREEDAGIGVSATQDLAASVLGLLPDADGLVISDYDKGVLSPELLAAVLPEAARRGIPTVVDPKVPHFPHYRPATVVTPNAREACEAAGVKMRSEDDLEEAGRKLLALLGCPHLLITRGEHGMLLLNADGQRLTIPTQAREVFDVSGAGDTVVATLALALAAGAEITEGAALANQAAGIVVGRVGTAAVSREELLSSPGLS
jgi:D-beta-D-heptose 7-phosphate kinase/D-beta-D-heptose 1-phosphate adenosyltransferase